MNTIQKSEDNNIKWRAYRQNGIIYSPSFMIKDVYCQMCWEGKRLLLRTLGPCLCINHIYYTISAHFTSYTTQLGKTDSYGEEFKSTNLMLSATFYELHSHNILNIAKSLEVDIYYSSERVLPSSLSQCFPPLMYVTGLTNQGMTCYINVILQTLFSIPKFRYLVITADDKNNRFLTELQALFTGMIVNASALKSVLTDESMIGAITNSSSVLQTINTQNFISFLNTLMPNANSQGDAQEFILFVFNLFLDTSIGKDVHDFFSIKGYKTLKTKKKSGTLVELSPDKIIYQHDLFLSVLVSPKDKLTDALRILFDEETLLNDKSIRKTSTYTIEKLPDILLISFQRSIYNPKKATIEKSKSPIKLSDELDLSKVHGAAEFLLDKDSRYVLFSVIAHRGTSSNGHYLAYILPYLYVSQHQSSPPSMSHSSSDMESTMLTDETLIGPACNLSLLERRCYQISDSHVSSVDITRVLSLDNQESETIYMLFYLRASAFQRICASNKYLVESIYLRKIQSHSIYLKNAVAESNKQYSTRVLVSSQNMINVSSDGTVIVSTSSYEVPRFAGLEFIFSKIPASTNHTISILPISTINNKIVFIHSPLQTLYETTVPITDISNKIQSRSFNNNKDQLVWYFTQQQMDHESFLFYLILYMTNEDIALIRELISALLGYNPSPTSTINTGFTFLGELVIDQASKKNTIKLARRTLVKNLLEAYCNNSTDNMISQLDAELNIVIYYKKPHDHQFQCIKEQTNTLTSGMLYMSIDLSHLIPNASNSHIAQSHSLNSFINNINNSIELVLEPLEFDTCSSVGMHAFKLAGLFMMPLSATIVQQTPIYIRYCNKYLPTDYTFKSLLSDLLLSIKMTVPLKCTLEEISHALYMKIAQQPIIQVINNCTKACIDQITYQEIINCLQIDLPQCLRGENCALFMYKHDVYIPDKIKTPANEHVALFSDVYHTGYNGSRGKLDDFHMIGLFTTNNYMYVSTTQISPDLPQRDLATLEDILPKKVVTPKLTPDSPSLLSATSIKRKSGFGPEYQQSHQLNTNLRTSDVGYTDTSTITLKYAFPRVFYQHIASIYPVRVLLVVHNIPVADLIIPMPRERSWQSIKLLSTQLRNFFNIMFQSIYPYNYTFILSLMDIKGHIHSFLESSSLSLLTIRGNPINTNGILRCDVCEKRPNAILYYKVAEGEYTGIGQLLTIDGKTPDTTIAALYASHERASHFLNMIECYPNMYTTLNGYNPNAGLLWVPQNVYHIFQGELLSISQSINSTALFRTKQSLTDSNVESDEDHECIEIWTCFVPQSFSETIPSDDKILNVHMRAERSSL